MSQRITRMSDTGRKWLVGLECGSKGPRLKAYRDSGGIWTIGVGQTRFFDGKKWRRTQEGDKFATLSDAYKAFYRELDAFEVGTDAAIRDDATQGEFDCFTSLGFNIGVRAMTGSTAVRYFNQRKPVSEVVQALERWNRVGGRIDDGLIERRRCETDLLLKGIYRTQGQGDKE